MTAETDLLPCPFCGSAYAPRLRNTHTASFWVSCSDEDGGCGAEASGQFFPGPRRRTRFGYDPEAPEGSKFDARTLDELHPEYRRAAESAIAAWNRRATAAKDAEVEAAREDAADAARYRWLKAHDNAYLLAEEVIDDQIAIVRARGKETPDGDTKQEEA